MRRGTTPDYILTIPGYDLSDCKVYVDIKQYSKRLTLTNERLSIEYDPTEDITSISFSLTQIETLGFNVGNVDIQVKFIDDAGHVEGTDIAKDPVSPIINESVIDYV